MPLDPTRAQRITASIVPILMAGDHMAIQNLYLRATGDPRWEDDGFSQTWIARFGVAIEPLALDWHQDKTGEPLIDRGTQYFHPTRDYVSCTLDARRASDNTVIDVKTCNAFRDLDELIQHYAGQLVVQQDCANADRGALLVVRGGTEPIEIPVDTDAPYRQAVWQIVDDFWNCITNLTPPFPLQFKKIVPAELWRTIDLDHDPDVPNWAPEMRGLLETWSETEEPSKAHEASKKAIKQILPDDAGKLFCSAFAITRARNNAVTIRRR